jgi:hypothetical protein
LQIFKVLLNISEHTEKFSEYMALDVELNSLGSTLINEPLAHAGTVKSFLVISGSIEPI